MEKSEMETMFKEVLLAEKDDFKLCLEYARAIVRLDVEELEMARAIISADNDLREMIAKNHLNDIEYEIGLRHKWAPKLFLVDQALAHYPRVAERVRGEGYKVALLAFSYFCSCDVNYTCKVLEELILDFESGAKRVERRCEMYGDGRWSINHSPSVLAIMAIFSQRPCWVIRYLFLPEVRSYGLHGDTVVFEQRQ